MTASLTASAAAPDRAPSWVADPALLRPEPRVLGWLTHRGLLTERVSLRCGTDSALRVVDQRRGVLDPAEAAALGFPGTGVFVREVELVCASVVSVFAQTLVPWPTLEAQPWLAELGAEALGARLARTGGAELDALDFALLPPGHPLRDRALRGRQDGAGSLWARRKHHRIGGLPFVVQEVFLPEAFR
jgi:chorismate--pyruvate lyase